MALSSFGSSSVIDCHVPERQPAADDRDRERRRGEQRQDVIGAVAGRAVAVAPAVVAGQEPVERLDRVLLGARPELDDHEARGRVRHEHREQPVPALGGIGGEPGAGRGEVGEAAVAPGADLELDRAHGQEGLGYGKIERIASRMRPMPPPPGADS